jgi:hypothetical protein
VFYSIELGTTCRCAGAVLPHLGSPSSAISFYNICRLLWLLHSIFASRLRACENGEQIITSAFIFSGESAIGGQYIFNGHDLSE